jgi:two-component system cell cycle sensor histidine kinase/response regulator CckA
MESMDETQVRTARLRWMAEEIARANVQTYPETLEALTPRDMCDALHELRVYQIELEMQNEELRRTVAELDSVRRRYFVLYNLAPVGYCVLSSDGLILEANLTACNLLDCVRAGLIRQPITRFILKEDQDIYYLYRKHFLAARTPDTCELRMVKKDGSFFWARLITTCLGDPMAAAGTLPEGTDGTRLVLSDITECKRVEKEKNELEARLSRPPRPRLASLRGRGARSRIWK